DPPPAGAPCPGAARRVRPGRAAAGAGPQGGDHLSPRLSEAGPVAAAARRQAAGPGAL
ncbi:MAG: hypothetical protein AVDCRST_MAG27-1832, partial [uncultured Craurococcus sp.]